jgi:hypothetical protein
MLNQDLGEIFFTSKSRNLFWLLKILRNAYPLLYTYNQSVKSHFAFKDTYKYFLPPPLLLPAYFQGCFHFILRDSLVKQVT